jgi:hypothetical protein
MTISLKYHSQPAIATAKVPLGPLCLRTNMKERLDQELIFIKSVNIDHAAAANTKNQFSGLFRSKISNLILR